MTCVTKIQHANVLTSKFGNRLFNLKPTAPTVALATFHDSAQMERDNIKLLKKMLKRDSIKYENPLILEKPLPPNGVYTLIRVDELEKLNAKERISTKEMNVQTNICISQSVDDDTTIHALHSLPTQADVKPPLWLVLKWYGDELVDRKVCFQHF